MTRGGYRGTGEQEFEVVGGVGEVGVFLSNGFALFGHAESSTHRTRGQRGHKPMGGTGPARNRAAAAVEKAEGDAGFVSNRGQRDLGRDARRIGPPKYRSLCWNRNTRA